jgi:formylglycine-generating enzyme required for sulfatase activity
MVGRNTSLPKHHWIEYRIGVNLGDVIIEADDIYGDGVNIATRLEGIADPGEVYISGGIYEQIKHKLVCGYESLGDRKVKNITDPVRVYRVLPDAAAYSRTRKRREAVLISLLSLTLLIIASGVLWYLLWQPSANVAEDRGSAPASTQSQPKLPATQAEPKPQTAPSAPPATQQASPNVQPSSPAAPDPQTAIPRPPAEQKAAVAPTSVAPAMPGPQRATGIREPEMTQLRGGTFAMGSNEDISEKPVHQVTIKPFAISKYPITVREWNECATAKACTFAAKGKDDAPVTNVSWSDAKQFVGWLAGATQKAYRLPSEAEWEYAARGDTQTKYWWGDQLQPGMANCKNCTDSASAEQPVKVGSFKPNAFGLYDMGGGVDQWVEDCWHKTYQGGPTDGSPWSAGDCSSHVIRSGSWKNDATYVRPSNRDSYDTDVRYPTHGFRVALSR